MRVHLLHRRIIPIILSVALPWLPACQPGGTSTRAVSLEEAKQITAEFEGATFVAPPRTISDITSILDQQKLADPEAVEKARAASRRQPPPGMSGLDLARFYQERGLAARKVSDVKRAIADLKEAERLSREADAVTRMRILWDLGSAEASAGNYADAIRYRERSIAMIPNINPRRRRGTFIRQGGVLALNYAVAGDLDAAERLLAQVEAELDNASPRNPDRLTLWKRDVYRAKARIIQVRGRYAKAESFHRAALRASEEFLQSNLGTRHPAFIRDLARKDLANNLAGQGRLVEAEVEARKALTDTLSRVGRYAPATSIVLQVLTGVINEQGRHAEAEKLARAAIDIYQQIGAPKDSTRWAFARRRLAQTLLNQGQWKAALAQFEAIREVLANYPETTQRKFVNNVGWALALIGVGRAAEARTLASSVLEYKRQIKGEKKYGTAEARGVLAMALAALGEEKEALAAFAEAIPILLSRSRQRGEDTSRAHRLGLILESYISLLTDIRGTILEREAAIDAEAEAFRIAGFASSRSVQRALAASATRASAGDAALADLVRREQDAQKQVSAFYELLATLLSVPTGKQNREAILSIRENIDKLGTARGTLIREIETRFPKYAELIGPKPATVEEVRASLRPGEALIATYVGKERSYIWAVPHQGKVAFAAAPLGAEQLSAVVTELRRALDTNARALGDIPDFDVGLAHKLFRTLLEPVREGWQGAESLLVVPHRSLGQLPFTLLPTAQVKLGPAPALFANYREVPWLVRKAAVTMLPSVNALLTLRALPTGNPGRRPFVGFGDPYFSESQAAQASAQRPAATVALSSRGLLNVRGFPIRLRSLQKMAEFDSADLAQLPRLPDTADEVRDIALALNADVTREVFTGKEANEQAVKTLDLFDFRVIAFATHGLVPGDLNGLTEPALALASPNVAKVEGDGLLTMAEILGLKLNADWVVLSACNTGAAEGAGAEAVSGLGRAFFYAGARALLVSNWPVETTSAKALTTDLFRRQAEDSSLSRVEAQRRAMLALVDGPGHVDNQGRTAFSYAHPIFWAPFSLVGDGGSRAVPGA